MENLSPFYTRISILCDARIRSNSSNSRRMLRLLRQHPLIFSWTSKPIALERAIRFERRWCWGDGSSSSPFTGDCVCGVFWNIHWSPWIGWSAIAFLHVGRPRKLEWTRGGWQNFDSADLTNGGRILWAMTKYYVAESARSPFRDLEIIF